MFGSDPFSTWHHIAKRQLWEWLPGTYTFHRDKSHHNMVIKGQKHTQADMKWSHGRSEIKPRDPTNPAYQSELVQATWFFISTKKDDLAVDHEVRVFRRLQNGEWSIWNTGSYGVWDPDRFDVWNINRCVVTEKITDLTMKVEEPMPSDPTLRSVQEDWKDGNGVGKYLGLTFCMDEKPHWIMRHRVEREGSETVQATTYSKIHGGPREGWPEWLMKGAKAGLQDLKGYFVPV